MDRLTHDCPPNRSYPPSLPRPATPVSPPHRQNAIRSTPRFSCRSKAARCALIKLLHELTPPQLYDIALLDQGFLKWPSVEWSVREYIQENPHLCKFCFARFPSLGSAFLHFMLNHIRKTPVMIAGIFIKGYGTHMDPLYTWRLH